MSNERSMIRLGVLPVVLALLGATLDAQPDRLTQRIDAGRLVELRGQVRPAARPENDLGPVEDSFLMTALTFRLRPSVAQQASLEALLSDQLNPASPQFHKWLSPEQYADRFGVSQADLDKLAAWLKSEGFAVKNVARARNWITFSGTAGQVQQFFSASIHRYQVRGQTHFANATNPSLPAAFAEMVVAIRGLDDFRLHPMHLKSSLLPEFNYNGTHVLAPDDIATIYDIAPLYQMGIDGAGQALAIAGQTSIETSDIQAFRSMFNLPPISLQQTLVPGYLAPGEQPDDVLEAELDIEWGGAVARNANINYVYSDDVFASLEYAIDQAIAPVVSMSYGTCEPGDLVDLPVYRITAQQASAEGITWVNSTGDLGAADCDPQEATVAQDGLAVDAPASTPEVTAAGGSEFMEQGGTYWASANTANSASALSYIPEMVWNDTATLGFISAGGGGESIYYPQPSWQAGPGVPSDGARHVPDISLHASGLHDGYFVYIGGGSGAAGGTSFAAPIFAGMTVLLNQSMATGGLQGRGGVGNVNPTLYRLAQQAPQAFHDITAGNNSVPCVIGSPECTTGSYGQSATSGYDMASGLGSPDLFNLIAQWKRLPAQASAVVSSIDQNPVFQHAPDANGNQWTFQIKLANESNVSTTLTSFVMNGVSVNIAQTFSSASIPANGSISAQLGLTNLAGPADVVFVFAGMDASGQTWSQQLSVPFSGPQIQLGIAGASNAASGQPTFAPGMLMSVYGAALGDFAQSAGTIPLPLYLAGFEANVNGVSAPLYYVSPGQANVQIPYETQPGPAILTVGNPYSGASTTIQVASAAPGIFEANGLVASPGAAVRGQPAVLFITGEGAVYPSLATGATPPWTTLISNLPKPIAGVTVKVGGVAAQIVFIGIPSGLVGVTQINVTIPGTIAAGPQPVVVTVGGVPSPAVNLIVQ